jgi:phage terminase large subunit GpA-like protein
VTEPAVTYEWYPGELEIWREKPPLTVSQFAAKSRKVTLGQHQGDWDNSITPYLTRIMDTYNLSWVQEIVIVGVPQSGKSNACINMHLYAIVYRGGNVKYVMLPKENLAKKIAKDRLIPIYRMCEPVAKKMSSNPDDTTAGRIAFRDGTVIYPVWGSSPSEISSFPADDVFADEVDKNEDLAGKETHALNLMEKRATTFRRPKKIKCSSPAGAGSLISKAFDACMEQLDFYVVCPSCGHEQQMKESQLIWPGQLELVGGTPNQPNVDPKQVLNSKSARYTCEGCGVLWNDMDRDRAVRLGDWKARNEVYRPVSVGFIIDAFICPDISLSEYAAAILKARSGDVADQIELDNSYRAKKYEPQQVAHKEDHILRLIDPHMPRGIVPRDTNSILIIADTQQQGFYYEVKTFAWGRELENSVIDHGFIEHFEHLNRLADRDWFDADGARYRARAGFLDSGGGANPHRPKHSRTREVYDFCIENPFWHPLKGRKRQSTPVSWTRLDFYPGSKGERVSIPGGLVLYTIDTTYYKNMLNRKLLIDPGNPGAIHLHAGLTEEEMESWSGPHDIRHEGQLRWSSYAKQMCSEYQDEGGFWVNPKQLANHHFDIGQYSYACADILFIGDERRPEESIEELESTKTHNETRPKSRRW